MRALSLRLRFRRTGNEASIRYCNGTQATKDLNLYVNGSYIETISFWKYRRKLERVAVSLRRRWSLMKAGMSLRCVTTATPGNVNLDKLSSEDRARPTISVPLVDNGGFEAGTPHRAKRLDRVAPLMVRGSGLWSRLPDPVPTRRNPHTPATKRAVYFYSGSAYQQSIHQGNQSSRMEPMPFKPG